jgi:hypothetical protein
MTTTMNTDKSFNLSRIYAKGWNAAKSMTSDELLDLDAEKISAMNPYRLEDERQRWREGFAGGSIK